MGSVLFKNARVFDGFAEECAENQNVLVEGGRIREISDRPIKAAKATVIDVAGRTLMPGLIDLHIHAYASDVNFQKIESAGNAYRAAHAASPRCATSGAAIGAFGGQLKTSSFVRRDFSMPDEF
jgi:imidazolonepropionase-like amidohydrolase